MPGDHAVFFASVFGAAAVFARLEIEIEGSAGWASALPTWRLENRWTRLLLGGRPLTGYHLCVHLFLLLVGHLPYALALVRPSLAVEARIASFLILFWVLEDFLWFVANPAFGIRRFRRENIPWHAPGWWWIMPREYWILTPLGLALYVWSW
ncbi:MAG TPA: hypothetical protein VF158_02590 [Longimicrobiales bacterium]